MNIPNPGVTGHHTLRSKRFAMLVLFNLRTLAVGYLRYCITVYGSLLAACGIVAEEASGKGEAMRLPGEVECSRHMDPLGLLFFDISRS